MQPEALKRVRKRFFDDFEFYAKHAVKIRSKEGKIVPLVLNRVQKRFVKVLIEQMTTRGRVRVIVLKARQQGLSTVITAFMYWWLSQHKAQKGVVVAHKADSTRALFDMYKRVHANTPEMLRQPTAYSSRKELVFEKLDTGLIVATAGGDGIARSETITHAHLSELAFWPKATAAENLNGLLQAIPNADGSFVAVESTANGYELFNEMWESAVLEKSEYLAFFAAWFETDEYRSQAPEGFERTYEEQELVDTYKVDNDQLQWRRLKIADSGKELFKQEYPATPEEAFIASGRPVFDPEQLQPLIEKAKERSPIGRMAVIKKHDEKTRTTLDVVEEHSLGELLVYKARDPSDTYTIGADVAMGIRHGDYSVAQVLDGNKEQVGVWRGHIHPDAFADVLAALGRYYNLALIAPERNSHGLLTCVRLWKDLLYPNVYFHVREGQMAEQETFNVGFPTNTETKPLVIDRLRAEARDANIKINDLTTLKEMQTYIVTESGAMEAEEGKHDDCVMALAIANHLHVRKWKPIAVTDEFYEEAI